MVRGLLKEPRLKFTEEERTDPVLEKPIRKAEQAAKKADKAQAKIPKKTVKVKETTVAAATGKKKAKIHFEEVDKKKPPTKLSHAARDAPGVMVSAKLHGKIQETEQDNVGVESAHKTEETAETGARLVREGYRSHQLKPYRRAAQAEHRLEKANVNALYQKSLQDNPQLASNPVSHWQQKQAIKKQYAAAKRAGQSAGNTAASAAQATGKAGKGAAEKTEKAAQFIARHKKDFLIAIVLLLLLALLMGGLSSCSVLFESTVSVLTSTSYPSRDADMLGAEAAYAAKEANLQNELDHYESRHPGYDEYRYELDDIKHDPYVLVSLLTAYYQGEWTLAQAQGFLTELFGRQYILTQTIEVETRYRTETDSWTDEDGNSHTDTYEVAYDYYICNVKLENFDLSHLPVYLLDEDKLGMYAGYMATHGNRPDLFPTEQYPNAVGNKPFTDYDIPPEALADEQFAAMIKEAEKYLGYPYVWGGASPSTSFDCSGFVSWVINHSGWNVGRLTANGLLNISTPVSAANAKPGDLIFFQGTYNTSGASHVGIYVGNGMMIHCGDPISYASINTSYWQQHFYTFARLP